MDIKSIKNPFFEGRDEKKGKQDQKVSLSTCDVQAKPCREISPPEVIRQHKSNFVCASLCRQYLRGYLSWHQITPKDFHPDRFTVGTITSAEEVGMQPN